MCNQIMTEWGCHPSIHNRSGWANAQWLVDFMYAAVAANMLDWACTPLPRRVILSEVICLLESKYADKWALAYVPRQRIATIVRLRRERDEANR